MTIQEIDAILAEHSIEHRIEPHYDNPNGALRVMAAEAATVKTAGGIIDASRWVDVTDWSIQDLYRWLGY